MIDPKERFLHPAATCPECGNETLMIDTSDGDYCYFCEEEQTVSTCSTCGDYFAPEELEVGMCSNCLAASYSRW
jgi:Zn finger protein HypA/HybF involved in hydrogenase expression